MILFINTRSNIFFFWYHSIIDFRDENENKSYNMYYVILSRQVINLKQKAFLQT